jgi:Skp family chaperone for outer membrane proteins
MKTTLLSAALLALGATTALAAPAAPPPPGPPPAPKILVIDRAAIMQFSKVGRDVARQIQAFANQAKNDMAGQSKALQAEGQALQQQIAILSGDAKQKKIDAFQAKEQGLQITAQRKEAAIQYTALKAQQTVSQTLGPIVQTIMQQRGANLLLDKTAVVAATGNPTQFDITQQAIDGLDQKMPALKVTLENPPAAPAPAPAPAAPAPAKK